MEHGARLGATALLHGGDEVHPSLLLKLARFDLDLHVVHGNNPTEPEALAALADSGYPRLHYYGVEARFLLAGRSIDMTHIPARCKAAVAEGEFDVACCGHEHTVSITPMIHAKGGTTWLVNPGAVGALGRPSTYVLGDLEKMTFDVYYP